MCLVLGRRGLGWSRPTFMGRSRPISCLDEWVGADPVFCLVEEAERVGMDVLLTPLVLDPTCQLRGPPVSLFFFFPPFLFYLLPPPRTAPLLAPPVGPCSPSDAGCLPNSSPTPCRLRLHPTPGAASPTPPRRSLPGRSLPPGRLLAASAGRSLPPSVGRRSLPPRRTAPGRSSRAWTRACNGRTQRPSMQVDATSVEG